MPCYVIAEAGVNHNGSLDRALALVDAAAESGADAVKFQTFRAERLARPGAGKAEYQKDTSEGDDQLAMLKALELSEADHRALLARCELRGIDFLSTPFDEESARFLVELGMGRIKVPSGELTNHPLLKELAGHGLPLILSTGMATLEEVEQAVAVIEGVFKHVTPERNLADMLTVLHCTSNYPAAPENVNLLAMRTLAETLQLPVGYSDHTLGSSVAIAAVGLGAQVLEKHFTLDRNLPGPDHRASLEVDELATMIGQIREVARALGDGVKAPTESELPVRAVARRSVTLVQPLRAGQPVTAEHLALLRPGDGIAPADLEQVIGRRLLESQPAWTTLRWDMFAP